MMAYFEFFVSEDGDVSFTTYTKEELRNEVARRIREEGGSLDDYATPEEAMKDKFCSPTGEGFGGKQRMVIKGNVVTPQPKQIVTTVDVE